MIEVEIEIWYWTPSGMTQKNPTNNATGYVTRRECERLLEEADQRRLNWARRHWGGSMPPLNGG